MKWRFRRVSGVCSKWAALLAVAAVGCADERTAPGIRAESVAEEAEVVLQDTAGPLYQAGAGVLLDSGVVLLERSRSRLLFFDLAGRLVRTVGRAGSGPGEFNQPSWLQRHGTSLFVYDEGLRRLSTFTLRGDLQRASTFTPSTADELLIPLRILDDSTVLVQSADMMDRSRVRVVRQPQYHLLRYGVDGAFRDSVAPMRSDEVYEEPRPDGGRFLMRRVFGQQTGVSSIGTTVIAIPNDTTMLLIGEDRAMRTLAFGRGSARARILPEDLSAARQRDIGTLPPNTGFDAVYDRMPAPTHFPTLGWHGEQIIPLLRATSDSALWIVGFGGVRSDSVHWTVVNAAGATVRRVAAGRQMELLDARGSLVLVRVWDGDGVESVQLRRVVRTP